MVADLVELLVIWLFFFFNVVYKNVKFHYSLKSS